MKRTGTSSSNGDGIKTKRLRMIQPYDDDDRNDQGCKWPSSSHYSLGRQGETTMFNGTKRSSSDSQLSVSSNQSKKSDGGSAPGEDHRAANLMLRISGNQCPKWTSTSSSSSLSSSGGGSTTTGAATATTTDSGNSRRLSFSYDYRGKKGAAPPRNQECFKRNEQFKSPPNNKKNTSSIQRQERGSKFVQTPHGNDVLCGRGPGFYSHQGNVAFRKIVNNQKAEYVLASSHDEKNKIAKEVLERMQQLDPPARFLERSVDSSGERWVEANSEKQFAKTSQALREGATAIKAQARSAIVGSIGNGNIDVGDLTPAQLKVQAELYMNGHTSEVGKQEKTHEESLQSSQSSASTHNGARMPVGPFGYHVSQASPSVHFHVHHEGATPNGGYETLMTSLNASLHGNITPSNGYQSMLASLNASLLANAAPSSGRGSLLASLNPPQLASVVPNNGYESLLASLNASPLVNTTTPLTVPNNGHGLLFSSANVNTGFTAPNSGHESLLASLNASLHANAVPPNNVALDSQSCLPSFNLSLLANTNIRSHLLNLLRMQCE